MVSKLTSKVQNVENAYVKAIEEVERDLNTLKLEREKLAELKTDPQTS